MFKIFLALQQFVRSEKKGRNRLIMAMDLKPKREGKTK